MPGGADFKKSLMIAAENFSFNLAKREQRHIGRALKNIVFQGETASAWSPRPLNLYF
jgi:hypothetical protein